MLRYSACRVRVLCGSCARPDTASTDHSSTSRRIFDKFSLLTFLPPSAKLVNSRGHHSFSDLLDLHVICTLPFSSRKTWHQKKTHGERSFVWTQVFRSIALERRFFLNLNLFLFFDNRRRRPHISTDFYSWCRDSYYLHTSNRTIDEFSRILPIDVFT